MNGPPAFLSAVGVSDEQLRAYLRSPQTQLRTQWQALVLREGRYEDVWRYLTIQDLLASWSSVIHYLGDKREPWRILLEGWRQDGLIP